MSEDRSLDEFAAGPSDGDPAGPSDGDAEDGTSGGNDGAPLTVDDVEPATTTSTWAGEGRRCERCGETVRRLWGEDGTLVCPDCKDW